MEEVRVRSECIPRAPVLPPDDEPEAAVRGPDTPGSDMTLPSVLNAADT